MDATWIRISFQALCGWIICNGNQPRLRILYWFRAGETFVLNTGWKNKLKFILVQALASPLGLPPKGTINTRMDKEQSSTWRENYLRVWSKHTMKILRDFWLNSEDSAEKFLCVSFRGIKDTGFILKRMHVDCKISVPARGKLKVKKCSKL